MVSLEPLLAWLRSGEEASQRLEFPIGTALPDGRLDLCKSNLGPLGAQSVVDALPEGGPVRHLLLGTDSLGDAGAVTAADGALKAGASTVYLGCNGIGEGGACSLAERIAASPGIVRGLWLKRNPIGATGVRAIAELIATGHAPSTIDLVQTGMTASVLSGLVDALASTRVVKRLFLSGNHFGSAEALARLVSDCGLEELYLSACGLGDDGARVLASGLKPGVRRLSVASNGIGPVAAGELVRAATLAGVEVVDLGRVKAAGVLGADDNCVDAAGIADALSSGTHRLWHMDLRHTGMDSRGALALLGGARKASSATRFVLGSGIARRVKRELGHIASALPELLPHPDVAAIRSVHR
ncbi:Leucine Rich repeat [Kibdelosporangium aridum]|uniref:Leucine Rich repeat n=1 Tax=Kibdelosporangium aridum TaxID=2030 RepID=A0A1Y5YA60_KIBAR|nr:Leucine Rich repeat [Kibdelosporangium aridum]